MPFSPETIAVKPYNQCIKCEHIGVKCDGPNVISMSKERFLEWCKQRKEELGWSNAKLSEISGLSKGTIDKMMSGKSTGLNGETISAVTCALVYGYSCPDGSWGKYPCAMVAMKQDGECPGCAGLKEQLQKQEENNRGKIDFLKQQIAFKEDQMKTKDHQLQERADFIHRKDRIITILSVLLGISVLLILTALIVDAMNPNMGFFWRSAMSVPR